MSNERDIIKSLLIKEELELLQTLREKVLSKDQFTQEVSQVLSGAVKRAQTNDGSFERALSQPIQKGVSRAFSDNKQSIIDGLMPIMGQLIRKTVSNSIKQFVSDINRTLELGFSSKALKWRWQAYKADITFAEMVFQKTIRYQVTEIFLINSDNGLLIEHVGTDDMLKDNDAISAMLSVIKEFIGDSLSSPDDDLQSAEMGGNLLFFAHGPKAFMTLVVKGSPKERFKSDSQKLIEDVHAEFSDVLVDENNYRENDELQRHLRSHLVVKEISDSTKKTNWLPWIAGLILIIGGMSYWAYSKQQKLKNITQIVNSIDGVVVQSITKQDGKFLIKGMVDPIADLSVLKKDEVTLETHPYISLDENIIKKRINATISDFDNVSALLEGNRVIVSGFVSQSESQKITNRLLRVAGVEIIINELTTDNSESIKALVNQTMPNKHDAVLKISHNEVSISGSINHDNYQRLISQLKKPFPDITVKSDGLEVLETTQGLIDLINKTTINIPSYKRGNEKEIEQLENVIKSLQLLVKRDIIMHLVLTGESDCQGYESDKHSQVRANTLKDKMIEAGIDANLILTEIKSCQSDLNNRQESLLNVSFMISN